MTVDKAVYLGGTPWGNRRADPQHGRVRAVSLRTKVEIAKLCAHPLSAENTTLSTIHSTYIPLLPSMTNKEQ
jgi:hypothetical protein